MKQVIDGMCSVLGTHLSAATGSFNAHALGAGGTSDDDDLALQAEHLHKGVGLGDGNHGWLWVRW